MEFDPDLKQGGKCMIESYLTAASLSTAEVLQKSKTEQTKNDKNERVAGKTIGEPRLSKKASQYYESLKKKYGNMEFILVSEDKKEQAKAQAAGYANAVKTVVLIDEEKVERMAEDEDYRKQYESIIASAASGISQLKNSLDSAGANVKGYGIQVNDDGTAEYFAVLKESSAAQRERIEKNAAEKKAEKKAQEKKKQQKLKEAANEKKSEKVDVKENIITASSIEELVKKVQDYMQTTMSDNILTPAERQLGQNIDFSG